MKLILVFSLLTVSVSAISAYEDIPPPSTPSCPCGRVYMPLCASNGVTYNNICEFECAQRNLANTGMQIGVIRLGRCEEPSVLLCLLLNACLGQSGQWTGFAENECLCTTQYDPVCGSNMRRYYNICTYECQLEYIRRHGLPMIDKIDCKWLPPPSSIH